MFSIKDIFDTIKELGIDEHVFMGSDTASDLFSTSSDYHDLSSTHIVPNELLMRRIAEIKENSDLKDAKVKRQLYLLEHIPTGVFAKYNLDFSSVEKKLNQSHFGMNNAKSQILESLQAAKYRGDIKFPYLCLYGSPGVGKTTLFNNIANALNAPIYFINMASKESFSIVGVDPAYKSANCGMIIEGLVKTQYMNPIFVFDEVDKMATNDLYGTAADTLLGICDDSQNKSFTDLFLGAPVDISKATFFFTVNNPAKIPEALRSRLTMIKVDDYTVKEKIQISKSFIIPSKLDEFKLQSIVEIDEEAVDYLVASCEIDDVTNSRSGGVRDISKYCERLLTKVAYEIECNKLTKFTVTKDWIIERIGVAKIEQIKDSIRAHSIKAQNIGRVGTVHSLAVTANGLVGLVDNVTCRIIPAGKGRIIFTGQMLDEPKDAALTAYHFIRANYKLLGIDLNLLAKNDFVIHSHDAAIKKDGTSAGIVYLSVLLSESLQLAINDNIAMTGQLDLDGSISEVGGIDLKIDACISSGLTDVYISKGNLQNVDDGQGEKINITTVENAFELISCIFPNFKWHCEECGSGLQHDKNNNTWDHIEDNRCIMQKSYIGEKYPQHLLGD